MVTLGKEYKDSVSGFKGIATSRSEFLNGCTRVCLTGKSKGNAAPIEIWLDEEQIIGQKKIPNKTGGTRPDFKFSNPQR